MPRVAERPVKSELRLGVMGAGRWGRHWVRVCHGLSGARLAAVCDRDPLRTSGLSSGYPAAAWYAMAEDMLKHAELDAVVIATPTSSHAALANLALDHGCHVLVEKPLAACAREAARLAHHPGGRVMVGHLLRYHPAVVRIAEMIAAGELGAVTHVLCERLGSAPAGREETAWWALAPHDISVMRFLLGCDPESIQASSMAAPGDHPESAMASLITFPGGRLGVIRVADGSATKVRRITVVGERRSVTFTDHAGGAALFHYDSPLALELNAAPQATPEPVHQEGVDPAEPLVLQGQHFVDCLQQERAFASDALEGLAVVRVLEAGSRALELAKAVPLPQASPLPVALPFSPGPEHAWNARSPSPASPEEFAEP